MEAILQRAPPELKMNYYTFALDPVELEIIEELKNRKRKLTSPEDPFIMQREPY